MKLLILVICLFVGVELSPYNLPINEHDKCDDGPEYWCRSKENAEFCGKINYCDETIWDEQSTTVEYKIEFQEATTAKFLDKLIDGPVNNNIPCDICKKMVTFLKEQLENKRNEANFKILMEELCKINKIFQAKCVAWIDKNFDMFYTFFVENVLIDVLSHTCSNGICLKVESIEQSNHVEETNIITTSPHECHECKSLLEEVLNEVKNNKSKDHIKKVTEEICSEKKYKICNSIEKNIDKIIDMLIKNENSQLICSTLRMCKKGNKIEKQQIPSNSYIDQLTHIEQSNIISATPKCNGCKTWLNEIAYKVGNNKSENHIVSVLQQYCLSLLDPKLRKICSDYAVAHRYYLVNSIKNKISSNEMCIHLGFCSKQQTEIDIKQHQFSDQMMEKYSKKSECFVCQLIAVQLKKLLKRTSTIHEINYAIQNVCQKIPKKFFVQCQHTIKNYGELMKFSLLTLSLDQLCMYLDFCPNLSSRKITQYDIVECGVCYAAVNALTASDDPNAYVRNTFINYQNMNLCIEMIDTYRISISNLINNSVKRSDVCAKIGKCFSDGDGSLFHEIKKELAISNDN